MTQIQNFLNGFLRHTDTSEFEKAFDTKRKLKKKEYLFKPHQNCFFIAFIHKGVFRVFFYNQEGVEVTVWFSFAGMTITDMLAFYKQTQTTFYIQAVEDAEVSIIKKSKLEKLYSEHPEYLNFGKILAEKVATTVMERMLSLQTKTAEERYLELMATPDYLQKIPLKYLASYLGITDTSLSRIRKNLP